MCVYISMHLRVFTERHMRCASRIEGTPSSLVFQLQLQQTGRGGTSSSLYLLLGSTVVERGMLMKPMFQPVFVRAAAAAKGTFTQRTGVGIFAAGIVLRASLQLAVLAKFSFFCSQARWKMLGGISIHLFGNRPSSLISVESVNMGWIG